jgi:hypothetical protein
MTTREYRPRLTTVELLAELAELLREQRRTDRLICRYLADLADRMAQPTAALSGYADIYHLARCRFGLGFRAARERIRVGRALRELPRIEQALIDGELCYSRVREVTRVARPEDEIAWLRAARGCSIRALERRVVQASAGAASSNADGGAVQTPGDRGATKCSIGLPGQDCAQTRFLSPQLLEFRMTLPPDVWALFERALQGARRASEQSLSDVEALGAVARDALARQAEGPADVRRSVVLYQCQHCSRTELDTGGEPMDLSPEVAARLGCGAQVIDLEREGKLVRRGGPLPASVRRAVLLRDRYRCRVPGCGLRRYVDVHHLREQSQGGVHSRSNCLCLCERHHRMLHAGQLRIEGDADADLAAAGAARFFHADGEPILEPRTGPGKRSVTSAPLADSSAEAPPPENSDEQSSDRALDRTHSGFSVAAMSRLSPEAAKLLCIMGHRGGWLADTLCEKSNLSASEVAIALTSLQLTRRVERDRAGRYGPLRARAVITGAAAHPGN